MQYVNASTFLDLAGTPMVDVRSPSEFLQGHIVAAESLPLFSDDERADVGTLYKQEGRQQAIARGLEIVGPKLSEMAATARQEATGGKLRVYCWRGGMRSAKMAELFELQGIECTVLEGGYKAYRTHLMEQFGKPLNLLVLQGPTGSGKTEILHELIDLGEQVIDLEGLANHRGSAFGGIGLGDQPSTQHFQNKLFEAIRKLDPSKRIWIESESFSIGRVNLPEPLWKAMNLAPIIQLDMPTKLRTQRLASDYGHLPVDELQTAVERISERFGKKKTEEALALLQSNDATGVADILLQYYDSQYRHSREKFKSQKPAILACSSADAGQNAAAVLALANDKFPRSTT